jgi:hypothetical protein
MLTEAALVIAARKGIDKFFELIDSISERRRTAKYERDKQRAYREVLSGEACDWDFVESVVEVSVERGDHARDAIQLRGYREKHSPRAPKKRVHKKKTKSGCGKRKVAKKKKAKVAGKQK